MHLTLEQSIVQTFVRNFGYYLVAVIEHTAAKQNPEFVFNFLFSMGIELTNGNRAIRQACRLLHVRFSDL